MTQIKKILDKQGNEVFIRTSTKAVIDDNGYTAESRLQAMQDEINAKQLEVGAVPSDLTPTENSTNWITSGGVYNATNVGEANVGIDLSGYTAVTGYISSADKWTTSGQSKFIPIVGMKKYKIVAHATNTSLYAFMTSNIVGGNNSNVTTFATGSSRVQLSAGEVAIDTAPQDAQYLWISYSYNSAEREPQEVDIYNKRSVIDILANDTPLLENSNGSDLDICDMYENVLAQFKNGHFRVKYFDTENFSKQKPSSNYELFYVGVDTNYSNDESTSSSIEDGQSLQNDLGLIQFSDLYSPQKPSRLVLWSHSTSAGLHTNSTALTTNCDLAKALLKAGYSIFQVNGTPGVYGEDAGKHHINPIWYRSVLAAYKYLTDKYCFKKDGIFTFGYSLGSHASLQLNDYGTIPILAQVCFAGNPDIWKGSYGHYNTVAEREKILDDFGMTENRPTITTQNPPSAEEKEYILDNIDKWLPFNPLTSGITNTDDLKSLYSVWVSSSTLYDNNEYDLYKDKIITHKPPVMLIYGENDTTNPPRWGLYYYRMLRNGGGYVKLRRYSGATHSGIISAGTTTQTVINGETLSMCGSNYEAFVFMLRFDL